MFSFENEKLAERLKIMRIQFSKHSEILDTINQKAFDVTTPCRNEGGVQENANFTDGLYSQRGPASPKDLASLKKKSIFAKKLFHEGKALAMYEKNFLENKGNKIIL